MPDQRSRLPPWARSHRLWLGLYLAILLVWLLDPAHPRIAGLFHDDGVYFCLGQSLVERGVYEDPHSPEPIRIAKYPPGEPALIAVCLFLAGETEEALSLLRLFHALFLIGALAAFRALIRREAGLAAHYVLFLLVAMAASPALLDYLRLPMSEIPYLALCLITLARIGGAWERPERPWPDALPLAGLCFLAFAFRTVGATLVLACLIPLFFEGRKATALRLGLLVLPAMAALQVYLASRAQPAADFEDVTIYGLPYGRVLADGLPWLDRVILTNLIQTPLFLAHGLFPQALAWLPRLGDTGWVLLWVVALGTCVLVGAGLLGSLASPRYGSGPRLKPWHLHLLLSIALVVPWPFQTARFLVPLLPFTLLLALQGAGVLAGRKGAWSAGMLLALAGLGGALPGRLIQRAGNFTIEGRTWNLGPLLAGARELGGNLPQERTVIASSMDPVFAVHGGLSGVWAWTISAAPIDLYGHGSDWLRFRIDLERYSWLVHEREAARLAGLEARLAGDRDALGKARSWMKARLGFLPEPLEGVERPALLALLEEARPSVREQFQRVGVTHAVLVLEQGQLLYEVLLARLVRELAGEGKAILVHANQDASVQAWRILP